MATYKVIQDIEAEDKFLGPLTLKQFIFGAAGVLFGYLSFVSVAKGAPFLLAILVPPALLGFFLAIPWSSQQSTEIWVLAKLRFMFKPRSRIWDQSGLEELVTINVPKKEEKVLTNGLDQTEVQSRLKALAETIDTRGWAVKNATLNNAYPQQQTGERLINLDSIPRNVPDVDVNNYTDVLDEDNAVSENFEYMIKQSSVLRKQQSLDKMQRIRNGEPLSAIQEPEIHFAPPADAYQKNSADSTADESLLTQQLRNNQRASGLANQRMRTISVYPGAGSYASNDQAQSSAQAPDDQTALAGSSQAGQAAADSAQITDVPEPQAEMTKAPNPAIVEFVDNNDLSVSTIARQAKKNSEGDSNEVVVSLR